MSRWVIGRLSVQFGVETMSVLGLPPGNTTTGLGEGASHRLKVVFVRVEPYRNAYLLEVVVSPIDTRVHTGLFALAAGWQCRSDQL